MAAERKGAFATGARRGIGKAIAISFAQGGFDVAIAARTVEPGQERERDGVRLFAAQRHR
jgi:NAD(P)-dependent dehydrogenase (short-subunit alcohol dehydrogenase family)